eukprot:3232963-Rhodomonas_salina.5
MAQAHEREPGSGGSADVAETGGAVCVGQSCEPPVSVQQGQDDGSTSTGRRPEQSGGRRRDSSHNLGADGPSAAFPGTMSRMRAS